MDKEIIRKIREAVIAQIDYEFAARDEDSEGYRSSPFRERDIAEKAWNEIIKEER